jgi:hypothetical protein
VSENASPVQVLGCRGMKNKMAKNTKNKRKKSISVHKIETVSWVWLVKGCLAFSKDLELNATIRHAIKYNVTCLEESENMINLHIAINFGKEKYTLKLLNKSAIKTGGIICSKN